MSLKIIFFCVLFVICINLYKSDSRFEDFEDLLENPYRELRLPPWSTMGEIKKKYNELVKKYHPDKNKGAGAQAKFLSLQRAYEKLKKDRKYSDKDDSEEADDPFVNALIETIQTILGLVLIMTVVYYSIWFSFKIYEYIWSFVIYIAVPLIFIDKLFPHYFKSFNREIVAASCIGLSFYYGKRMLNWIRGVKNVDPNSALVNDANNMYDNKKSK